MDRLPDIDWIYGEDTEVTTGDVDFPDNQE